MSPAILEMSVSACLLAGMLAFIEVGFRVGRRGSPRRPSGSGEGIGTVDAAVFGLLGLALAFTYSGAATRLDTRRAQIVQEANAIGTAYLRIDLLPQASQAEIRDLFRRYLDQRIEVFDKFLDREASTRALDESARLQREIWARSVAACREETSPSSCMLVVTALNEMIDITTTRTMATLTHAPTIVIVLLVLLSFFAALLSGYTMSLQGRRNVFHMILFALAISSTVYVVLDLEYPRAGLVNLSSMDRAIVDLREMMK